MIQIAYVRVTVTQEGTCWPPSNLWTWINNVKAQVAVQLLFPPDKYLGLYYPSFKKGKVVPVLNWLSSKQWRHLGEWMYVILTSALAGGECSASHPGCFTTGERALGTHWTGGWVGPRTDLHDMEKRKISPLLGLKLRPLGRPAHSQSLYRLSSPGSYPSFRCLKRGHRVQCM
jgi:hypothetical protein